MHMLALLLAYGSLVSLVDAVQHHAAPPPQYPHHHRANAGAEHRFTLKSLLSKDVRRVLFTLLGLLLAVAWLYKRYTASTARHRQRAERTRRQQPAAAATAAANDTAVAPSLFQRLTSTGRSNAPSLTPSIHPQEVYLSASNASGKQRLVVINAAVLDSTVDSVAETSNVAYVRRLAQSNAVWIVQQEAAVPSASGVTSTKQATAASDAGGLTVPPMTQQHQQQVDQLQQRLAKHNLLADDRSSSAGVQRHRVLLCSTARGKVAIVRHLQPSLYVDAAQHSTHHGTLPDAGGDSPLDICKELAPYLKDVVYLSSDAMTTSTVAASSTSKGQVTVCSTLYQYFHR